MEALNLERGRREERAEGDRDAAKTVWLAQFLSFRFKSFIKAFTFKSLKKYI